MRREYTKEARFTATNTRLVARRLAQMPAGTSPSVERWLKLKPRKKGKEYMGECSVCKYEGFRNEMCDTCDPKNGNDNFEPEQLKPLPLDMKTLTPFGEACKIIFECNEIFSLFHRNNIYKENNTNIPTDQMKALKENAWELLQETHSFLEKHGFQNELPKGKF